jgi:hypothetical protein
MPGSGLRFLFIILFYCHNNYDSCIISMPIITNLQSRKLSREKLCGLLQGLSHTVRRNLRFTSKWVWRRPCYHHQNSSYPRKTCEVLDTQYCKCWPTLQRQMIISHLWEPEVSLSLKRISICDNKRQKCLQQKVHNMHKFLSRETLDSKKKLVWLQKKNVRGIECQGSMRWDHGSQVWLNNADVIFPHWTR